MLAATHVGQQPQPGGVMVNPPDTSRFSSTCPMIRHPRRYTVSAVFAVKKVTLERGGFVEAFGRFGRSDGISANTVCKRKHRLTCDKVVVRRQGFEPRTR